WGRLLLEMVAGIGAYLFFRDALRVSFWPAVIGAWAFPLGGFLTFWVGQPMAAEASWLGLLLWATDGAVRRPTGFFPPLLALLPTVVLGSGHAETGVQMLMVDGVYALWAMWRTYGRPTRALVTVSCAWLLGIALSMPQTLTTAEYLRSSYRIASRAS